MYLCFMKRICKKHGLTEFSTHKDGRVRRCRRCSVEAVDKRRRELKRLSVEYKGGECSKCGYNRCIAALEFHHLDPTKKDFGIGGSKQTSSWKKIQIELDKCILLCSNCHREEHFNLYASKTLLADVIDS